MDGRTLKKPPSGKVDQEVECGLHHGPDSDDKREAVRLKWKRDAIKNAEGSYRPEPNDARPDEDIFWGRGPNHSWSVIWIFSDSGFVVYVRRLG